MLAALAALTLSNAQNQPVLAGYLPAWRTDTYNFDRLAPLTDVLYFSIQPNDDGSLNLKDIKLEDLPKLAKAKKKHGFRLLICIGGWERSAGFMPTATDPAKTARFVRESVDFCDKYGFDGVDLDWEHPKNEAEGKAYGDLIEALSKALAPKKRIVTAAIAAWQTMSPQAVQGLDRVHLMSYDHPDRHASMDKALSDVDKLQKMGFPPAKIVLGVPFYGRKLDNWNDAKGFADLSKLFDTKHGGDEAGGYYYNGRKTLEAKSKLVKDRALGGVMIWEVAHDVEGDGSLLNILAQSLRAP